jgi:hypothetical protein
LLDLLQAQQVVAQAPGVGGRNEGHALRIHLLSTPPRTADPKLLSASRSSVPSLYQSILSLFAMFLALSLLFLCDRGLSL